MFQDPTPLSDQEKIMLRDTAEGINHKQMGSPKSNNGNRLHQSQSQREQSLPSTTQARQVIGIFNQEFT